MARYLIENTPDGYRLSLLRSSTQIKHVRGQNAYSSTEVGGHGPIERVYSEVSKTWLDLEHVDIERGE